MRPTRRSKRLVGERVELRRHDRANYPLYARWYGDDEIWHLTSWTSQPMQRAAVERLFEEREKSSADDSFAIHRREEDRPIGVISLSSIGRGDASADLSVILGEAEARDQGLGTEAIHLILSYAFEDLGLNSVALSVFDFNETAIRTYENLGFEREGRMREAIRRDDGFHDAILMRILASAWREDGV